MLQAFCLVKMASASLRAKAVTSKMTVGMAQMKKTAGRRVPLKMAAVDGKAPWLIILIGHWVQGLSKEYDLHMITLYKMKTVILSILKQHQWA